MMTHIDVHSVLRQTLACDLYSNLVTRPTGAAVRSQIEQMLGEANERGLAVIDFSQVSMIDFSCADEVVAKLLIHYTADDSPRDAYFLFRGVTEDHLDAIESVLERHGLALALEREDGVEVLGVLSDAERRAWDASYRLGRADAADVATELDADPDDAQRALDALCRRRLVMCVDGQYVPVGTTLG
ncbi:MAG TPA: hypothetical protein VIP11_11625 [Gemmatimonadaceae bacterium]